MPARTDGSPCWRRRAPRGGGRHPFRGRQGARALQAVRDRARRPPRRDSAARRLIEALPAAPVLTASSAATLIDRSFQATGQAIDRLVTVGVLAQANAGRRNRTFEAPELIEAFTALERQLASPAGDTRVSEPVRRVPRRK